MRTRLIRPEHFTDERLVDLEPLARLLYAGLPCCADRGGILEDRPRRLKLQLFPGDSYDVNAGLDALQAAGLLLRYTAPDGLALILLTEFEKDQRPHRSEVKSVYPRPTHTVENPGSPDGQPTASGRTTQDASAAAHTLTLSDTLPLSDPLSDSLSRCDTLGDTLAGDASKPPEQQAPPDPKTSSTGPQRSSNPEGIRTDYDVSPSHRARLDALVAKHTGGRVNESTGSEGDDEQSTQTVQNKRKRSSSKRPGRHRATAGVNPPT